MSLKPITVYQHVKERLVVVRRCKIRHKKKVHETTSCTSVGYSVGYVDYSVGITLCACPQRHFYTPPSVAAPAAWRPAAPICPHAGAYTDYF